MNWHYIEQLSRINDAAQLFPIALQYAKNLGFDNFGMALQMQRRPGSDTNNQCEVWHGYQNEWSFAYQRLKDHNVAANDARVQVSKLGLPAGAWNTLGESSYQAQLQKHLPTAKNQMQAAGEFGMRGGVTLPILSRQIEWGFMTLSSNSMSCLRALENELDKAAILALALSARLNIIGRPQEKINLTSREIEILQWSSIGKTAWEISVILGFSERTINAAVPLIAEKLGVRGKRAACTAALSRGLITI